MYKLAKKVAVSCCACWAQTQRFCLNHTKFRRMFRSFIWSWKALLNVFYFYHIFCIYLFIRRHGRCCVINGKTWRLVDWWQILEKLLENKGKFSYLKFTLNIDTFQDFNDTNAIIDSCYQSNSLSLPYQCLASVCLLQNNDAGPSWEAIKGAIMEKLDNLKRQKHSSV